MAFTLVTNEDGSVKLENGVPVYVDDTGKEQAYDPNRAQATITKLNHESASRRTDLEKANDSLKLYDGIDANEARTAIDAVKNMGNLEGEDLVKARIQQIEDDARKKNEQLNAELQASKQQINQMAVNSNFANSAFAKDRMAMPVSAITATFGPNFSIEEGRTVAKDVNGQIIMTKDSTAAPGTPAPFDEALETLVTSHPEGKQMLKGGKPGSGGQGGHLPEGNKNINWATLMDDKPAFSAAMKEFGAEEVGKRIQAAKEKLKNAT